MVIVGLMKQVVALGLMVLWSPQGVYGVVSLVVFLGTFCCAHHCTSPFPHYNTNVNAANRSPTPSRLLIQLTNLLHNDDQLRHHFEEAEF